MKDFFSPSCEDFGCTENELSAAEQIKPDCCHTPAVVSILLTPLPVSCPSTTPLRYIIIIIYFIPHLNNNVSLSSYRCTNQQPVKTHQYTWIWIWIILNSELYTKKHVIKICQTAYSEIKRISSISRFLTEDGAAKTCFVTSLDYCNCFLMGTPNAVIQPLHKIQNFAARLSRSLGISPPPLKSSPEKKLHWLPLSERIK